MLAGDNSYQQMSAANLAKNVSTEGNDSSAANGTQNQTQQVIQALLVRLVEANIMANCN